MGRRAARSVLALTCLLVLAANEAPAGAAPSPSLVDRAAAAGLGITQRTYGAATVDVDRDGDEDVWIGFHQRAHSRIWVNGGNGTYTPLTTGFTPLTFDGQVRPDRHDCVFGDVNNDTWPDAYCSTGRNEENVVKTANRDNELYLNRATAAGQFDEVGSSWGVGDPCGRGRAVAFLDVDGDGWRDLFVGNQAERDVPSDPCNAGGLPDEYSKVFLNQGGIGYGYATGWLVTNAGVTPKNIGMRCAVPLDFNRDGRTDLLACSFATNRPFLLRNDGTRFTNVAAAHAFSPIAHATTADLNRDGRTDLVMAATSSFSYRLGTATGFGPAVVLRRLPQGVLGRTVAVGDVNGDGREDIYLQTDAATGNPDDVVLLAGSSGTSFTAHTVPSAAGRGDTVTALRPRADGRAQFLVLNGQFTTAGPIQLIAWR